MQRWQIWIGMAAALLVVGCKKRIDKDKLEKVIRSNFTERVGTAPDSVNCPKNEKAKKGDIFTCTLKMGAMSIPVEVTQTSDNGDVSMRLVGMVSTKAVQDLVKQKAPAAVLDCGGPLKAAKKGESFECSVTGVPNVSRLKITATDDNGTVNIDAVPPPGAAPAPAPATP